MSDAPFISEILWGLDEIELPEYFVGVKYPKKWLAVVTEVHNNEPFSKAVANLLEARPIPGVKLVRAGDGKPKVGKRHPHGKKLVQLLSEMMPTRPAKTPAEKMAAKIRKEIANCLVVIDIHNSPDDEAYKLLSPTAATFTRNLSRLFLPKGKYIEAPAGATLARGGLHKCFEIEASCKNIEENARSFHRALTKIAALGPNQLKEQLIYELKGEVEFDFTHRGLAYVPSQIAKEHGLYDKNMQPFDKLPDAVALAIGEKPPIYATCIVKDPDSPSGAFCEILAPYTGPPFDVKKLWRYHTRLDTAGAAAIQQRRLARRQPMR